MIKSVTLEDKKGHIFTVDIEFVDINPKSLLFNEIYPPIFEKNKKNPPHLRSCSQIMSRAERKIDKKGNKKEELVSLAFNSKTHGTLEKKIFVDLYAEDLYLLTTKAGWKLKYIAIILLNKIFLKENLRWINARKSAKTKAEKDFYKLLNNSNFGNDCRNNIDNCSLELMYDDLNEPFYIKKFTVFQNQSYQEFFYKRITFTTSWWRIQ